MRDYYIPVFSIPSTTIFIDDSYNFLTNFTLGFSDKLSFATFKSPLEALKLINNNYQQSDHFSQRCVSEYLDSNRWPMTNQTINIDLSAIHMEVYNPKRFSEISVIVVDYAMPEMNGLEFCKQIENPAIKKILLTGEADESIAIQAFNEGIIHRFVQKSNVDVTNVVLQAIQQLQKQYFQQMSESIIKMLSANSPNCLQDRKFSEFFYQLIAKHNIVEFYLTENSGSFLLLDEKANSSSLIVKTEQDLQLHYDLALDNKAPDEVLQQLDKGEKIPCFWSPEGYQEGWTDWSTFLIPAKKIICNETYFYAYIKTPVTFDIRQDKILSYHNYLQAYANQN